jgi:hypothetical protein
MVRWTGRVDDLLITKVNGDLTIADQYLQRLLGNSGERLDAFAKSAVLRDVMDAPAARRARLRAQRRALGLDFLYLTDGTTGPDGLSPTEWPVVQAALDEGQWGSVVDIMGQETLTALDLGLGQQAEIRLVPTRAAVPTTRTVEDRSMVIHSAAPVTLPDG